MNTLSKPRLIVAEPPRTGLAATTWESRQGYRDQQGKLLPILPGPVGPERPGMTAPQLAQAMGDLHCHHPEHKERQRPRLLLPMPNLAGRQPVISRTDCGILGQWREQLRWLLA